MKKGFRARYRWESGDVNRPNTENWERHRDVDIDHSREMSAKILLGHGGHRTGQDKVWQSMRLNIAMQQCLDSYSPGQLLALGGYLASRL